MGEIKVKVIRSGRVIDEVVRPLHLIRGANAVRYRRRLWPVQDGRIDLDGPDLEAASASPADCCEDSCGSAEVAGRVRTDTGQNRIINASAVSRMLVSAGPGTGKTQVAALRLAHLVGSELSPSQILVLSFSRSAVRTLTRRIEATAGHESNLVEELRHVSIRTFDSWTFRILRLAGNPPELLLSRSHDDNIATLADLLEGPKRGEMRHLIGDRRHLIIDEFQDLPGVRGRLVLALLRLLAPPGAQGAGFTVLGDPVQAIYGFAARAEAQAGLNDDYWEILREEYGSELQIVSLTTNHRATKEIAEFAAKMRAVLEKPVSASRKLRSVRREIARLPLITSPLSPSSMTGPGGSAAILTRTNGEAMRVAQKLLGPENPGPAQPVRMRAGGQVTPAPSWIAALLSPLKSVTLTKNQFLRIHSSCAARLGDSGCAAIALPPPLVAWSRLMYASGKDENGTALDMSDLRIRLEWPDAFPDDQLQPDDGILVTTVHQSKGMEFDCVALLEAPEAESGDDVEASEEASVGFVAVTRAAKRLSRIPANSIYRPPTWREFDGRRSRLCSWWNGWVNLEIGIRGDVDPASFVDPELHGSATGVQTVQTLLLERIAGLRGHKVILVKARGDDDHVFYDIHLHESSGPGQLLGRTTQQVTRDLLDLLWKRGYFLPSRILNLRIGDIGTMTASEGNDARLEEPHRTSRLWLGISLLGTGDFKPKKRNGS